MSDSSTSSLLEKVLRDEEKRMLQMGQVTPTPAAQMHPRKRRKKS
jgi:hypothetical protein